MRAGIATKGIIALFLALASALVLSVPEAAARADIQYLQLKAGPEIEVGWLAAPKGRAYLFLPKFMLGDFASDQEVRDALGPQRYGPVSCSTPLADQIVTVTIPRWNYPAGPVTNQLFRRAVIHVWQECSANLDASRGMDVFQLGGVEIVVDGHAPILQTKNLRIYGDTTLPTNHAKQYMFEWQSIVDVARHQEVSLVAPPATPSASQTGFFDFQSIKPPPLGMQIAILVVLLLVTFGRNILRLAYEMTPHPAEKSAKQAIRDKRLDFASLKAALNRGARNRVEREVREEQLRHATEQLRQDMRRLAAEQKRRRREAHALAERKADGAREQSLTEAEEAFLRTALEHQTFAAQVEKLRKRQGHDG